MRVEPRRAERGSARTKRKYLILDEPTRPKTDTAASAVTRFAKSRHELISEIAYFKAERRGFVGGDPDRDWHEAEMEVEELLRKGRPF